MSKLIGWSVLAYRKGTPLGQSVEVDSLWADPSLLPDRAAAARALGARLKEPAAQILQGQLGKGTHHNGEPCHVHAT